MCPQARYEIETKILNQIIKNKNLQDCDFASAESSDSTLNSTAFEVSAIIPFSNNMAAQDSTQKPICSVIEETTSLISIEVMH